MRKTRPVAERFADNVDTSGDCWLWTGYKNNMGYGLMHVGGKRRLAHRLAYEAADCPIPDGWCVLHMCDTPLCVRPTHLRLGTKGDNSRDMASKGRHGSRPGHCAGATNANAKLTNWLVREMRSLHRVVPNRALASRYGVSVALVEKITGGRAWKIKEAGYEGSKS